MRILRLGAVCCLSLMATMNMSCDAKGTSDEQGTRSLSGGPVEVHVSLSEYRFGLETPLPAGRVVFRFSNSGTEAHRPALLPLPEDFPPIQEEVRNPEARILPPFAGISTQPPGSSGLFAVDLVAGRRYALVCFIASPDGIGHSNKGMTWETRIGTSPSDSQPVGPHPSTSEAADP